MDEGAQIKRVRGIYLRREEVLLIQTEKSQGSKRWTFPGGKVENGDGVIVGLKRIVSQEIGITPDMIEDPPFYSNFEGGEACFGYWISYLDYFENKRKFGFLPSRLRFEFFGMPELVDGSVRLTRGASDIIKSSEFLKRAKGIEYQVV